MILRPFVENSDWPASSDKWKASISLSTVRSSFISFFRVFFLQIFRSSPFPGKKIPERECLQKRKNAELIVEHFHCPPLTAFAILSYGKRDFAEAESRKTEIGESIRVAEGEV